MRIYYGYFAYFRVINIVKIIIKESVDKVFLVQDP